MDEQNFRDVSALPAGTARLPAGTARIVRFLDYAPPSDVREVPDPYYTGEFDKVYALADAAADGPASRYPPRNRDCENQETFQERYFAPASTL